MTVDGQSSADIQHAVDVVPAGGVVQLPCGTYYIDRSVTLGSNITLVGAGAERTVIVPALRSACHMFTNADHREGNQNIELQGFSIDGRLADRPKVGAGTRSSFDCGAYFKRVHGIRVEAIEVRRVAGAALHFTQCTNVRVTNVRAEEIGWSGVSTSGTDDIVLRELVIANAGSHGRHSGIHLGGGRRVYVDATVSKCSGNAIMVDAKFAPFRDAFVKAVSRQSRCGLALWGESPHNLDNVFVTGQYCDNEVCGILISRSSNVFIVDALIASNGEYGVGRRYLRRGRDCLIADCHIVDNPTAIRNLGRRLFSTVAPRRRR